MISLPDDVLSGQGGLEMKTVLVALLVLFGAEEALSQNEIWTIPKPKPVAGAEEYKQGEAAFKSKDWSGAISAFEAAVSKNADLFASYYYLGWAYKNVSNHGKAASSFAKFVEKAPADGSAAEMVNAATREAGTAYARAKQYNEAISFLNKAAAANSRDTEVQFFLGFSQMQNGDEVAAEKTFSKVIQLQPNLDRAHYYAGLIDYKAERFEQAKERLTKYLELSPDGPFAADAQAMLDTIAAQEQAEEQEPPKEGEEPPK
jgi:tetratricopeptide (TPR) repeat protein